MPVGSQAISEKVRTINRILRARIILDESDTEEVHHDDLLELRERKSRRREVLP